MVPGRPRWIGWAVALGSGLALLSAADAGGFRRYLTLRQQIHALEQQNVQLTSKNAALVHEVEALRSDRRAQERAVREELGFVKPHEVVIEVE